MKPRFWASKDGRMIRYCRSTPAADYGVSIYPELEVGPQRMPKTIYDQAAYRYDPIQSVQKHGEIYPRLDKEGRENWPSTTMSDCRDKGVPMNAMGVGLG